ncbi:DUF7504 family protein [Halorussus caseinilyticus]|uniref:Uncharacterized protein n=1 Tax=Halorussus caseinilyticus TaxID=3034025 RepID=A0ABD5WSG9_9EURY
MSVGDANLTGLRTELGEAMREFCSQSYRPAEVRVTVDSLAPLLDHYEFDVVRRFLRAVGERVYDCDAMAHYVLPRSYDSEWCRRLRPEFDAVVEPGPHPRTPRPKNRLTTRPTSRTPERGHTTPKSAGTSRSPIPRCRGFRFETRRYSATGVL